MIFITYSLEEIERTRYSRLINRVLLLIAPGVAPPSVNDNIRKIITIRGCRQSVSYRCAPGRATSHFGGTAAHIGNVIEISERIVRQHHNRAATPLTEISRPHAAG